MSSEDLGVAQRDADVEGIGDGRAAERVWADVAGDGRCFRDAGDHSVGVSAVDGAAGHGAQDESSLGTAAAAGLEDAQHRDGDRHGGGLVALPDDVQYSVSAQCFGVVLDPDRGSLGCP